jgi:hypothetical protein
MIYITMAPKFNPVLSIEDARRKLIAAVAASHPVLDALMVETAVDIFMAHPNSTPDELIASVPAEYFHSTEWKASHPEPIAEEPEEQALEPGVQAPPPSPVVTEMFDEPSALHVD